MTLTSNSKDLSHGFAEHPIYHFGDKVAEICKPLFDRFPINYLNYGYVYRGDEEDQERKIIFLACNAEWSRHYMKNGHSLLTRGKKIDCWQSVMPAEAVVDAGAKFNHYNGVCLNKVHPDYIEVLELASPDQQSFPFEFCNDKELLNQFLIYFKDKARDLFKTIEKDPFHFPKDRFLQFENPDQDYEGFCQMIKAKKLSFKFKSKEVIFTRREFEMLSLLVKGKRIGEIARILRISQRTAETHLYNAKNKTELPTVSRLLDYFVGSLF